MKQILIVVILLFISIRGTWAIYNPTRYEFDKNWVFGGSVGVSYLAMELKKDLTQATMDMNSRPDKAYSFHLYKRVSRRIDLGIQYRKSYFNGYKTLTENVNWLVYSERFNSDTYHFIQKPIEYHTTNSMWSLDGKWNFLNLYSVRNNYLNVNFYLRGNIGLSYIGVAMGYKDPNDYVLSGLSDPIYEKGQGSQKRRDAYASYSVGFGLHHQLSSRWSVFVESSLLMVSCDYLDGVQNYTLMSSSDGVVSLQRVGVYDTIGLLQFGINYQFDLKPYRKQNGSKHWQLAKSSYYNEFYHDKKFNKVVPVKFPFKFRNWKSVKDR